MSRLALAFGFGALRDVFVRVEAKSLALCRHVDVVISVSSSWGSLLACLDRNSKPSPDSRNR